MGDSEQLTSQSHSGKGEVGQDNTLNVNELHNQTSEYLRIRSNSNTQVKSPKSEKKKMGKSNTVDESKRKERANSVADGAEEPKEKEKKSSKKKSKTADADKPKDATDATSNTANAASNNAPKEASTPSKDAAKDAGAIAIPSGGLNTSDGSRPNSPGGKTLKLEKSKSTKKRDDKHREKDRPTDAEKPETKETAEANGENREVPEKKDEPSEKEGAKEAETKPEKAEKEKGEKEKDKKSGLRRTMQRSNTTTGVEKDKEKEAKDGKLKEKGEGNQRSLSNLFSGKSKSGRSSTTTSAPTTAPNTPSKLVSPDANAATETAKPTTSETKPAEQVDSVRPAEQAIVPIEERKTSGRRQKMKRSMTTGSTGEPDKKDREGAKDKPRTKREAKTTDSTTTGVTTSSPLLSIPKPASMPRIDLGAQLPITPRGPSERRGQAQECMTYNTPPLALTFSESLRQANKDNLDVLVSPRQLTAHQKKQNRKSAYATTTYIESQRDKQLNSGTDVPQLLTPRTKSSRLATGGGEEKARATITRLQMSRTVSASEISGIKHSLKADLLFFNEFLQAEGYDLLLKLIPHSALAIAKQIMAVLTSNLGKEQVFTRLVVKPESVFLKNFVLLAKLPDYEMKIEVYKLLARLNVFAKSLRIDHFDHKAVLSELFQHYFMHSKETSLYEHLVETLALCPFDKASVLKLINSLFDSSLNVTDRFGLHCHLRLLGSAKTVAALPQGQSKSLDQQIKIFNDIYKADLESFQLQLKSVGVPKLDLLNLTQMIEKRLDLADPTLREVVLHLFISLTKMSLDSFNKAKWQTIDKIVNHVATTATKPIAPTESGMTKSTLNAVNIQKEKTIMLDFHALNQYLQQLNEQQRLLLKETGVAANVPVVVESALSKEEEERAREKRESEERAVRAKEAEKEKGEFAEKYDSLEKQFQELKEMKKIFEENNSRKIEALTKENADGEQRIADLKGKVSAEQQTVKELRTKLLNLTHTSSEKQEQQNQKLFEVLDRISEEKKVTASHVFTIQKLTSELDSRKLQVASLTKDLEVAKMNHSQETQRMKDNLSKQRPLSQTSESSSQQNLQAQKQILEFTTKIEELVKLNAEIEQKEKGNYLRVEKEKFEIEKRNEFLDSKLEQEQAETRKLRAEIAQLQEGQKKLKDKLEQDLQKTKFEHEKEVAVLKGKTDSLQETQDRLVEKALADSQARITSAEEERRQSELKALELASSLRTQTALAEQHETLAKERGLEAEELASKVESSGLEVEKLKGELEELKQRHNADKRKETLLTEEVASLNNLVEKLKSESSNATALASSVDTVQIESLKTTISHLKSSADQYEQEKNELQTQVEKLKSANADGGTLKMKMLRERLEKSMENAKATAEREKAHAIERMEAFEKQKQDLELEANEVKRKYESLKRDVELTDRELRSAEDLIQNLKEDKTMDTQTIKALTEQSASDRRRIAELEALASNATTSQSELSEARIAFANEMDKTKAQQSQLAQQNQQLQNQLTQATSQASALEREKTKKDEQHKAEVDNLNRSLHSDRESVKKLEERLAEQRRANEALVTEKETLLEKLNTKVKQDLEAQASLAAAKLKSEVEASQLEQSLQILAMKKEALNSDNATYENTRAELESNKTKLATNLAEYEKTKKEYESKNFELHDKMESSIAERKEKYDKMLSSLQASVDERKKTIKAQQVDNEKKEKQNTEFELSLANKLKDLKAKEKEWVQIATKDKEFLAKAKRLDDDLVYLEKKRKDYDEEHTALEQKMQRLKALKEDVARQEKEFQNRLATPQTSSAGSGDDIPQWKKNLMAQKNNWLAQDKSNTNASASTTTASATNTTAPQGAKKAVNFASTQLETKSISSDPTRGPSGNVLHPRQIADNLLAQAFRAIKAGNQGDFRQTFETKSEVDFLDDLFQGNTLLHWCVVYNQPAMALSLLSDGARSDIVNNKGVRALDMANEEYFSKENEAYEEIYTMLLEWE